MQRVTVVAEQEQEEHPARRFVHHLFEAGDIVIENDSISLWEDASRWKLIANYLWSEGILYVNLEAVTWFDWFDFDVAKRMVQDFQKRVHVKVAFPVGRFVDHVANRFSKDLIKSSKQVLGLDRISLLIAGQPVMYQWIDGKHVMRDDEFLGDTTFFLFSVARWLVDEWTRGSRG